MSETSTPPDLVQRVRGLYAAANRGDLDATVSFFAPGAVWEAMMEGASFEGVEGRRDGLVFGASPTSGFQPTVVAYRADKGVEDGERAADRAA